MKCILLPVMAILAASLLAVPCNAAQILIYRYSSSRPWTQYDCYRPDAVSTPSAPVIPKATRAGTYTQTEYWIINKSTAEIQSVVYYSRIINGATVKEYVVNSSQPFTRDVDNIVAADGTGRTYTDTVSTLRYYQSGLAAANTVNVCISFGDQSGTSTEEGNFTGVGKNYTVATGLVFDKVATSLTGNYMFSSIVESSGAVPFRSIYQEAQTTATLTLDSAATKSANTGTDLIPYGGGTAISKGAMNYGVRVAELLLEGLGYENINAPVH